MVIIKRREEALKREEVAVSVAKEINRGDCVQCAESKGGMEERRLGRYVTTRYNTRNCYLLTHSVKRHK